MCIETMPQFLSAFTREAWKEGERIVILIDEFDLLYAADHDVREDCLTTFRGIRQSDDYVIDSIIVCGTFSLWGLTTTDPHVSPFNISSRILNPYFTLESTQSLFKAYGDDEQITIDDTIVDDVFFKSNGYVSSTVSTLLFFYIHGSNPIQFQ